MRIFSNIAPFTVTLLLALAATTVRAQVFTPIVNDTIDFIIEGTASEGADTIYVRERPYTEKQMYPVCKGHFRIAVSQPLHKFIQIEDEKGGLIQLIVDSLPARVEIDLRTNTVVAGSPLNKRFNQSRLALECIENEILLHDEDADRTVCDSLDRRLNETVWTSITENLDNVIPVYYLSLMGQFCMISPERLGACMQEEYAFTHHPDMECVWKFYWELQKRLPGQVYHDIELADTTGVAHRLSEYVGQGHYVLLDFWASWCGPCIGSMPMMKRLHDTYADRGLQIIGISFDRTHSAWLSAIRRLDLPWVHLSDIKGWESIASEVYGIRAIPETVLIAPDGIIISTGLSGKELEMKIEEVFRRQIERILWKNS